MGGATRNGEPIRPSGATRLGTSLIGLSDTRPGGSAGSSTGRSASALDLCSVACGRLDAFVDCSHNGHSPWDYLGGMLVCLEAGAVMLDAFDGALVVLEHDVRRTPIAAATQVLLGEIIAARRSFASSALIGSKP